MNNPRFQIGETVIALTNPENNRCQHRVAGRSHTVTAILFCSGCGRQMINIHNQRASTDSRLFDCDCGNEQGNSGVAYTLSELFVRPAELTATLSDAIGKEDYETAAVLRDLINKP